LSLLRVLGTALLWLGIGLSVHDFILECINPYRYPPHGFWYGILLIILGWILLIGKHIKEVYLITK